jgi:DNA-binding GntR family transcriptional regulator
MLKQGNGGEVKPLAPAMPRRTAHEFVRDTLRAQILNGSLDGGTRLVQADIAAQLRVSTTPVREALRDLATEGLIKLDAHRGATVLQLDLDDMRDIYELRELLEPLAMRRAAERLTDQQLEGAAALQERMDGERDPVAWVELNRQFHAVLVEAADSPRLAEILARLRDSAANYVGLSFTFRPQQLEKGNHDHHRILDACRRRDPDGAADGIAEHMRSTWKALEDAHWERVEGRSITP